MDTIHLTYGQNAKKVNGWMLIVKAGNFVTHHFMDHRVNAELASADNAKVEAEKILGYPVTWTQTTNSIFSGIAS